jgi:hypothetical protein
VIVLHNLTTTTVRVTTTTIAVPEAVQSSVIPVIPEIPIFTYIIILAVLAVLGGAIYIARDRFIIILILFSLGMSFMMPVALAFDPDAIITVNVTDAVTTTTTTTTSTTTTTTLPDCNTHCLMSWYGYGGYYDSEATCEANETLVGGVCCCYNNDNAVCNDVLCSVQGHSHGGYYDFAGTCIGDETLVNGKCCCYSGVPATTTTTLVPTTTTTTLPFPEPLFDMSKNLIVLVGAVSMIFAVASLVIR